MECPRTGRSDPDEMGTCDASLEACAGCPMHYQLSFKRKAAVNLYEMLMRIYAALLKLGNRIKDRLLKFKDWITHAVGILLTVLVFSGIFLAPAHIASADAICHNPDHQCPLVDLAVRTGAKTNGTLYKTNNGVTYVYDGPAGVSVGTWNKAGKTKTFFAPKRNLGVQDIPAARDYVERNLTTAAAKKITAAEAKALLAKGLSKASTALKAGKALAGQAGEGLLGALPCIVYQETTNGAIQCAPNNQ